MIISASYKTDIPTFYGDWFMHRLRAGYCKMLNPYNRHVIRVSLKRDEVQGIVFWTKNAAPFIKHLAEVKDRRYPFIVHHTINGYPRALETSVVDAEKSTETAWRIRDDYGPRALVWRYDTILLSSLTPPEFHLDNFKKLASRLEGATDEVVVSFAHMYQKTERNLRAKGQENGFTWSNPTAEEKRSLLGKLLKIAREHRIMLSLCSQKDYLIEGVEDAKCVDSRRLEELAGTSIRAKLKGNRKECGCHESRDIGDYDTCPHGCVYCYAVQNRELALSRYRQHNPESEFLFEPPFKESKGEAEPKRTLSLFGDDE